jgi:hypothetical protein
VPAFVIFSPFQEHFKPEMTLAEAEVLALSTLKQVMEEKVRSWALLARERGLSVRSLSSVPLQRAVSWDTASTRLRAALMLQLAAVVAGGPA